MNPRAYLQPRGVYKQGMRAERKKKVRRTRRERHVVGSAREDDIGLAELDLLRSIDDGLEATAAEPANVDLGSARLAKGDFVQWRQQGGVRTC